MVAARDFTVGAILVSQIDLRLDGSPWWAEFLLALFGLVTVCLRIVFPQDSADRVTWWRERLVPRRRGEATAKGYGKTPARMACRGSASKLSNRLRGRS